MFETRTLKDDVARAIVFKSEFKKCDNLKDRYARFTYLFPSLEDKVICKAIFDVMFFDETQISKFVDQMINDLNREIPQKLTEAIDAYSQAAVWVEKTLKKNEKLAEASGARVGEQQKQGSLEGEDLSNTSSNNPFIVAGNAKDPNRVMLSGQVVSKKGKKVVAVVSRDEIDLAKDENSLIAAAKKRNLEAEALKKQEIERKQREAYEKSLKERIAKKELSSPQYAAVVERVLKNSD